MESLAIPTEGLIYQYHPEAVEFQQRLYSCKLRDQHTRHQRLQARLEVMVRVHLSSVLEINSWAPLKVNVMASAGLVTLGYRTLGSSGWRCVDI